MSEQNIYNQTIPEWIATWRKRFANPAAHDKDTFWMEAEAIVDALDRRPPTLPDVMEDGEKLPGQTLNLAYLTVNINNGRSKPRIFVGLNYVTDFSGNRAMLCFHGEEAKVLFGFDPNETHHVQNNQIVKVEV